LNAENSPSQQQLIPNASSSGERFHCRNFIGIVLNSG
jgi:hypothetical protein